MKRCSLFALTLISSILSLEGAALPPLPLKQVEAEQVNLEDKTIHLAGHVKVVHEMGVLSCDESTLVMSVEKKEGPSTFVSTIHLKGNVTIDFSDGSRLLADEGDIDCQGLEGTFTSIPPSKVTYLSFATADHQRIPVRATGRAMTAKITKTPAGYALTSMRGEGAINIEYLRSTSPAETTHTTMAETAVIEEEPSHE